MLLEVYDAIMDGTCSLSQAVEIVATVGDYNDSDVVTQPLPDKKVGTTNLFDFLDMSPSDSNNGFNGHPVALPAAKVHEPTLPASYASKSTVTAPPSTIFDPFANDPAPFGPSSSSIDDLLTSPPSAAKSTIDDIFGVLSTPTSVTEQRKPLRFDPMQAFDAVPSIPFQQYSMTGMASGAPITSSSMNGDFNPFSAPSGMPNQHNYPQQSYPQQGYGNFPPSVADRFDPYFIQNRPPQHYQQTAYQGQQPPSLQSMPNPGHPIYQPGNNLIFNDGRQALQVNATGAPPSAPPPVPPQPHQNNPFDGL